MLGYIYAKVLKKVRGKALLNSSVARTSKIESGSTLINSVIADHSFCGYDCTFINVSVGKFCSLASRIVIGGARHPIEYVSTSPVFLSHKESIRAKFARHDYHWEARTVIEHDVWIGEGVFVKGGVTISVGRIPEASSFSMAWSNAPTPGRINRVAPLSSSAVFATHTGMCSRR